MDYITSMQTGNRSAPGKNEAPILPLPHRVVVR